MDHWHYQHVEVTSKSYPSRSDGTRRVEKFNCIVAFLSTKPHQETIKNYLSWYHGINTDSKSIDTFRFLTDSFSCAEALAIFYFREKYKPFLEAEIDPNKYVFEPPSKEPDFKNEHMAIWVNPEETECIDTEHSVAILLRDVIRSSGKISVETARRLIYDKFGTKYRLDSEVLAAFSNIGGKYTKKYLRL